MDREQAPKTHHLKNKTKKEGRKRGEGEKERGRERMKERAKGKTFDYAKENDSKNRAKILTGRVKTNRKPLL